METETELNNTFIIEFYAVCTRIMNRTKPNWTSPHLTQPNQASLDLNPFGQSFSPWH